MIKMKEKQEKRQKSNRHIAGSDGSSNKGGVGESIIVKSQSSHNANPKKISKGSNEGLGGKDIIYEEDQE